MHMNRVYMIRGSQMWKDLFCHATWRELGRFFDYNSSIHISNKNIQFAGPNGTGFFIKHWKTRKVLETSFYYICRIWNGCSFCFCTSFCVAVLALEIHILISLSWSTFSGLLVMSHTMYWILIQYFQHTS